MFFVLRVEITTIKASEPVLTRFNRRNIITVSFSRTFIRIERKVKLPTNGVLLVRNSTYLMLQKLCCLHLGTMTHTEN